MATSGGHFSHPLGMGSFWSYLVSICNSLNNSEGMTKYFSFLKKLYIFLAQMFLQLALLPQLGHKEAIGTLGYLIASKLED